MSDEYKKKNNNKLFSKYEFVKWCLDLAIKLNMINKPILDEVINSIIVSHPLELILELNDWYILLADKLAKKEITISESNYGISMYNLNQSTWIKEEYLYILGLNQGLLFSAHSQKISQSEVIKLLNNVGVVLNVKNNMHYSYYVDYLLGKENKDVCLSYPETDFMGEFSAPEIIWQAGAYRQGLVGHKSHPGLNNLDIKQQKYQTNNKRIKLDLGAEHLSISNLSYKEKIVLSNSSLERYSQCPFIYFTEKILGLKSEPILDVEDNPLNKGSMYHCIVENLTTLDNMLLSDQEVDQLVEKSRKQENIKYLNQTVWSIEKNRYIKFTKKFIENELTYRNSHPDIQIKFIEKKLKYFWSQKNKSISSSEGYPIVSIIDRVDQVGNDKYILTDYKSTRSSLTSFSGWAKNKKFQLVLYYLMYETFLKESNEEDQEVAGLFYFILNDLKRDFGLKFHKFKGDIYEVKTKVSGVSDDQFYELVDTIKNLIFETVEKIEAGFFPPVPVKLENCQNCNWSKVCRAPHLI